MTKKCKCGREIEDRWNECYTCSKKSKEKETPTDRHSSIERQVAAKCAAQVLTGQQTVTEDNVVRTFDVFLRLIRG